MTCWKAVLSVSILGLGVFSFAPNVQGHGGGECSFGGGFIPLPVLTPPDPAPANPGSPPSPPGLPDAPSTQKPGGAQTGGGAGPTPPPPPSRPTTGGGATRRGSSTRTDASDRWEFWWESNQLRWLVPSRARDEVVTAAGANGASAPAEPQLRGPSAGALRTRALPQLLALLSADEASIVDASALALGHIVRPDEANLALTPLIQALDHAQLSVRESATLALGLIGSPEALPTLRELLHDTRKGRELTAHPAGVEQRVRAFAAAALGLIGERASFADLRRVVDDPLLARHVDLQQVALFAMGLLRDAHAEVVPYVLQFLGRRDVDRFVRAQAPIVLARLAADPAGAPIVRAGLARLVALLQDGETEKELRRSTVVALGRIACGDHAEAIDALITTVARCDDGLARHFALIALGEIGGADREPAANAAVQQRIELTLAHELESPRRGEHRPFAALALGLWSRNAALPDEARARTARRLIDGFAACSNPSHRGALALGLGLARTTAAAAPIAAAFAGSKDATQKGYLALALGLLRADEHAATLADELARGRLDANYEIKLARSLALIGPRVAAEKLGARLAVADTSAEVAPTALALALTGESDALEPLIALAADATISSMQRGVAAESLGVLAAASELPWNAVFAVDTNYFIRTPALAQLVMLF